MLVALKTAIFASGYKQQTIAAMIGVTAVRLSKIVRGHVVATEAERKALAAVLKKPESQLFPDEPASPPATDSQAVA